VGPEGDIEVHRILCLREAERTVLLSAVTPLVFVVDDDVSVRESLELLITDAGWRAALCTTSQEFLDQPRPPCPCCLILDVSLPDLNGLELQRRIGGQRTEMPIIFLTGHGDIPMSVEAMKGGAAEFLTKPVTPAILLAAIENALLRSQTAIEEGSRLQALRDRYDSLSARERQVMELVVRGQLNKQVGGELGIEEITVKAHRGRVMRKMGARSLPELVIIASHLGLKTAGRG
jgi:FixJ family two-component response regulator